MLILASGYFMYLLHFGRNVIEKNKQTVIIAFSFIPRILGLGKSLGTSLHIVLSFFSFAQDLHWLVRYCYFVVLS